MRKISLLWLIIICQTLYANKADSLILLLQDAKKNNDRSGQLDLSIQIGQTEFDNNNFNSALIYFEGALKIAEQVNSPHIRLDLLGKIGTTHLKMANFSEAIKSYNGLINQLKNEKEGSLAEAYTQLARAYRGIGNNEMAYEAQHTGLQLYEKANDSLGVAQSLYYIGNILFYQSNYEMAIEYYERTLQICQRLKSDHQIFSSLSAIGASYNRLGKLDQSLEYNRQALALALELEHEYSIAYAHLNIGSDYYEMKDYSTALGHLYKSLELNKTVKNKWGEIGSCRFLGQALMEMGQMDKSLEYLNAAHKLAAMTYSKPRLLETNKALAEYYRRTEDFQQANVHLQNYADLKDSIANEMTIQKMASVKFSYEIAKKEKAISEKQLEIERFQRNFLLFGLAVLLVFCWLLVSRYLTQKKNNQLLKEKNQQILSQNQLLEQSNTELKRFAHIASHDLKEPLRSIGSYANLLQRRYKGKIDENADEYLEFIMDSTKRLYSLLNDVLNFSKLDFKQGAYEEVNLNQLLDAIKKDLSLTIQERNASIEFSNMPSVQMKDTHLQQLFKNLISNSIKYSNVASPFVKIGCEKKEGQYEFSVSDNGIGIDPDHHQKIFGMFQRLHGRGEYEGNGLGLAICKKIVEQYNGKIWVSSEVGKGSTFYFTLPDKVPKHH